jgi:hypothetical protein
VFNYRTVDQGIGCDANRGVVSTRLGVFFLNRRGVYLTTGGNPTLISSPVDGIFTGVVPAYFASSALNQAQVSKCAMTWCNEKLYVAYPSGSATVNDRVLVWDSIANTWSLFDLPAGSMTPFRVGDSDNLMFAYASGTNDVGRHGSSYTQDAGVNISSRYRTGFVDLGGGTEEKYVRELVMDGIGSVGVSVMVNDASTVPTATTVALGSFPATGNGRYRKAFRGRNFSVQLASVSGGAWTVNQATAHVRSARPPGAKA